MLRSILTHAKEYTYGLLSYVCRMPACRLEGEVSVIVKDV